MAGTRRASIRLSEEHWSAMQADVDRHFPFEACGLVGGEAGASRVVIPIRNALASASRFRMDPAGQLAAMNAIEDLGWEMLAIYHSHPNGPTRPSETDIAEAAYPEAVNLIWSKEAGEWTCRGFLIQDNRVREIVLHVSTIR